MSDDNGGDADTASQNQNTNVANRGPGAKIPPKRDAVLTAREELLARMDAQIVEQRSADDETFFQQGDPRAIALAAEMGRESRGQPISADRGRGRNAAAGEEAEPQVEEPVTAIDTQDDGNSADPLEEFVIRRPGQPPMFRTVVNGKERLIPLEQARTQLQKHLNADLRQQQLSERQKFLDSREAQLRARETRAPVEAQPIIDDAALETEANELVRSLVSESEATAAKKLANTLKKIRSTAPAIDPNVVADRAADRAVEKIAAQNHQKALVDGLSEFQKAYPEMVEGSDLYFIADRKTTAIAAEHPDWSPDKVMLEAGKQTREWVRSMGGKPGVTPTPKVELSAERQQRKNNLKPLPTSRSARPAAATDQNEDDSPQSAIAEIRKARGQVY